MAHTNNKTQEMDVRNIMQGLEEFASFMSFSSDYSDMKIISVETVSANEAIVNNKKGADIIPLRSQSNRRYKSLQFFDKAMH